MCRLAILGQQSWAQGPQARSSKLQDLLECPSLKQKWHCEDNMLCGYTHVNVCAHKNKEQEGWAFPVS